MQMTFDAAPHCLPAARMSHEELRNRFVCPDCHKFVLITLGAWVLRLQPTGRSLFFKRRLRFNSSCEPARRGLPRHEAARQQQLQPTASVNAH